MTALAVLLAFAAWPLLSLAMPRHQQDALGRTLPAARARALRGGGIVALAASLAGFLRAHGAELGAILWTLTLMLGSLAWVLALTAWAGRRAGATRARDARRRRG